MFCFKNGSFNMAALLSKCFRESRNDCFWLTKKERKRVTYRWHYATEPQTPVSLRLKACFKMQNAKMLKVLACKLGYASLTGKRYITYTCVCVWVFSNLALPLTTSLSCSLCWSIPCHLNACFVIRSESFHFHFVVASATSYPCNAICSCCCCSIVPAH